MDSIVLDLFLTDAEKSGLEPGEEDGFEEDEWA